MSEHIIQEIKELRADMNSGFEKINNKIGDSNVILAVQAEQLKEHIRRTNLLEETQEKFKEKLEVDLTPLKEHVQFVNNGLKILGAISAFLALALAVKQLFF